MALGNIGRVIAGQAIDVAKKNVLEGLRPGEPAKPGDKATPDRAPAAHGQESVGSIILGQMQAMQRALKDDQELAVFFHTGSEMLRVLEIFVPSLHVFVLAGADSDQNVTRAVVPADSVQLIFKILKVAADARPVRVNVLSPRPKPEGA